MSFIVENYWSANASLKTAAERISSQIHSAEDDFLNVTSDNASLERIRRRIMPETQVNTLLRKKYFLFFYATTADGQEPLVFWNNQQVLPYPSLLYEKRSKGFVRLQNGFYVWLRFTSPSVKALALIPVRWNYIIENENLRNVFVADPDLTTNYEITARATGSEIVRAADSTPLFYLQQKPGSLSANGNPIALALRFCALLLFLLFIQLAASFLATTQRFLQSIAFLFLSLLSLRVTGYAFNFNLRQLELFSPVLFNAGYVFRSLGDTLLNILAFAWFVLFVRYHLQDKALKKTELRALQKWIVIVAGAAIMIISTFGAAYLIRSLVRDSRISFDVMNFFTLNVYSLLSFLLLCCLAIAYYFSCQAILLLLRAINGRVMINFYLSILVLGLILFSFGVINLPGSLEFYILLWLLLFVFLLNSNFLDLLATKIVSSKLVFWIFFFSASITVVIVSENQKKEFENRLQYAQILAAKADRSTATLVNTMLTAFREDFLVNNFSRFYDSAANKYLKDSLRNENISSYTNRYNTRVYTYNAAEEPLYNEENTISFNDLNTILTTQARATGIPGLYFYDKSYEGFSYIHKKSLTDSFGLKGYMFIVSEPKQQKSDAISPSLFSSTPSNSIENSSIYSVATYKNFRLVTSGNDYAFPAVLHREDFKEPIKVIRKEKHHELWYYAGADRIVAIVRKSNLSLESITLFSYSFCSFLLISAFVWFLSAIVRSRFNRKRFIIQWQFSIRNQIHGTIIFISVLSFLVIGLATILFFMSRYEINSRDRLSRSIRAMANQISVTFNTASADAALLQSGDTRLQQQLEGVINQISEIQGVDVNLYDVGGNLRVSSLSLPYIKGIVSTKMHPSAFYHLHQLNEVQFYQKENIGKLRFESNYIPVMKEDGSIYAYLNIPFFRSQANLNEEISNFLVTIINLNAFIFLLAGIVALFITNRITNSFSVIADKMKRINLGSNEPIIWKRDDEVGELVREYNKMVMKLEESARILAKTEREGAWREMARQVAHEIKNPLTPMKLSMQYLEKSIENDAPNVKQLTLSVTQTLVEQIDHLSHIASEFGQFANIEDSKNESVDINIIIKNVVHLYHANDQLRLTVELLPTPVKIKADKTHINRLFNNLLLNAIQAVAPGEVAFVKIEETVTVKKVLVSISDNGQGISEELREKIFMPNFTTKTSGTGLGLAMCKRMVEQAEGKIWFDTAVGRGTTFYIEFPLLM